MLKSADSQDAQQVLRESVRRAKEKLCQVSAKPTNSSSSFKHFDTFNQYGSSASPYKDICQRKPSLKDRSHYDNDVSTESKPIRTDVNNQQVEIVKEENARLKQHIKSLEQQLELKKHELLSSDKNFRLATSDLVAMQHTHESLVDELKRDITLKQKLIEKYQQDSAKLQQQKQESDNYCRQLANEYTILLSSKSSKQQADNDEVAQYRKKIETLSRELGAIKELLLKGTSHPQSTSREKLHSKRQDELSAENIRLQGKIKSLKHEVTSLKSTISNYEKELHQLKTDERVWQSKLFHYEKKNEVLLQEAARNGLTVSYGRLQQAKFTDGRPERKKSTSSRPKSNHCENKQNHCAALNKKKLTLW